MKRIITFLLTTAIILGVISVFTVTVSAEPDLNGQNPKKGTCGSTLAWELNDGVLTISGDGIMYSYGANGAPWYDYRKNIKTVIIGDKVTKIGRYAFFDCTELTEVTIGSGVTSIYGFAFLNCASLTKIVIPDAVINIANNAFEKCTALKEITIGSGLKAVQGSAFLSSGLQDVYYSGTEEQWNNITISSGNDTLKNAKKHFSGGEASIISAGNVWIIIAVLVLALGGVAALVIIKKKKKTEE
ncbi:MAG: leucine-rich repeat domain-containing protein [Clostridiales bacterium]|nr:leucine-rich repeat domain-containing protein [Candidatus Equinaster intestinalis]